MKTEVFYSTLRVICTCGQCDSAFCALQLTSLIKPIDVCYSTILLCLFTSKYDNGNRMNHSRDEWTVIFCDPDPVLSFQNLVQVQPQSKLSLKLKVQVQIKSKKLTKYSFSITKIMQFFSINPVQIPS